MRFHKPMLAISLGALLLSPIAGEAKNPAKGQARAHKSTHNKSDKKPEGQIMTQELKIVDTLEGKGRSPVQGKNVTVHYTGKLENGTVFDSSVKRGDPIVFPIGVGYVIKGWDEGLQTMKVGGKRTLTIPPHLGYGEHDMGAIPPNSTLIFDVELVDAEE